MRSRHGSLHAPAGCHSRSKEEQVTSTLNKQDLVQLSTVEMAEGIASGEISVLELA